MLSFERFCEIAEEINAELPKAFFRELNGGVQADPKRKVHPKSVGDELVILGEYHRDYYFGRYIVLYYGSFLQVYGNAPEELWRKQLDHTIRHEFRHHLESLAGERGLEVEDAIRLAQYQNRKWEEAQFRGEQWKRSKNDNPLWQQPWNEDQQQKQTYHRDQEWSQMPYQDEMWKGIMYQNQQWEDNLKDNEIMRF